MSKWVSLLIVLYPLLHIYCFPGLTSFSLCHIIVLLTFAYSLLKGSKFYYNLPNGFNLYWCYISLTYLLLASSISLGLFIPAGYSFFIWVILFWLCYNYIDYATFKKYYRIVFICCSLFFLYQELCYYTIGNRPLFMLPLPFYGVDRLEIIMNQTLLDRSSSFFMEPSHFAQFSLPLLAIEIFDNSKKSILNLYSAYIIFILFLLQSGNGLVGILVLLSIRMLTYLRQSQNRYKYLSYVVFIPFALLCLGKYVGTEIGSGIMERFHGLGLSKESESAARIVLGYYLYSELPFINKIFGYHIDAIESFASTCKYNYLFLSKQTGEFALYLNGFQHVLILNGFLGTVLFFRIWIGLYRGNDLLSKSLIIMFVLLMFISNQYLGQMMLICMLIPYKTKKSSMYNRLNSYLNT